MCNEWTDGAGNMPAIKAPQRAVEIVHHNLARLAHPERVGKSVLQLRQQVGCANIIRGVLQALFHGRQDLVFVGIQVVPNRGERARTGDR